jgi:LysM repeat protein
MIFQASEARIADPDLIHPGAQISVPALEGSAFALTVTDRQGIAKGYVAAYRAYLRLGSRPARPFLLEARRRDPAVVQPEGMRKGGRGIVGLVPSPGHPAALARASPAPGAAAPGVPGGMYVVKRGDTLWVIAEKWYGDALLWPQIFRASEARIADPDLIQPGAQISVPALEGSAFALTVTDRHGIAEGYVAVYRAYRRLGTRPARPFLLEARRRDPAVVQRMEAQRP